MKMFSYSLDKAASAERKFWRGSFECNTKLLPKTCLPFLMIEFSYKLQYFVTLKVAKKVRPYIGVLDATAAFL